MTSEQKTVKFETLLSGYSEAHNRFEDARRGRDSDRAFRQLFEALNWAVSMDDHIGEHWKPEGKPLKEDWKQSLSEPDRSIVEAIRFARNRVHHQWADALQLEDDGIQFPVVFPTPFHEWAWVPTEKLPPGRKDWRIEDYRSSLQGKAARLSLSVLGDVYRRMTAKLKADHD